MIFTHMAMLSSLPCADPVRDENTRSMTFHQTMSPRFIKRSIRWHLWLLVFGALFLLFYTLLYNGTITYSGRRSIHVLGFSSLFVLVYCIAGLAWTWMIRKREYRVDISSSGEIELNNVSLPDALLTVSTIRIYDACRLGDKFREIDALVLSSRNKDYVLFAHDERSEIEHVIQQLSVRVIQSKDTLHLYGVL